MKGKPTNVRSIEAERIALERGLPANLDVDCFVLGAILMDDALYIQVPACWKPKTSGWRSIAASSCAWASCTDVARVSTASQWPAI
jgi:hypothetical protein